MGEIRELQTEIGKWRTANFRPSHPEATPYISFLVIVEELGELARALVKGADNIRGGSEHWKGQRPKESADIVISLCAFCCAAGIDLEDAIEETWKIVGARVNGEHNPDE